MKPKELTRAEFICPCCFSKLIIGAFYPTPRSQIVEQHRDKLKAITQEPMPRRDIEDAGEIVAGCDDQRKIVRSEQVSIDELFRKDKPFRRSAA